MQNKKAERGKITNVIDFQIYCLKLKTLPFFFYSSSHYPLIYNLSLLLKNFSMYKNQLQELAQRSCFNLPSYTCIREGPDHAPRFKACVNFNGEMFESPSYCTTLRQAEHSAAELALHLLSSRGPSKFLTARVLDETGIYKNLLQETAHRAGLDLPVYTTVRSGPGHLPVFTCNVELAGMNFKGESAKTKKQAEKNAAIAAWSSLKKMPTLGSLTKNVAETCEEEEDQVIVTRVLSNLKPKKDEGKQVIKRTVSYQSQARRKVMKSRDSANDVTVSFSSSTASTSGNTNIVQHQQWRKLMELLVMDMRQESSSSQKQNFFANLLPPPPPPTASKILASSSTRPHHNNSLQQVKGKSQIVQQSSLMLEEHQKDEEEWLSGKSAVMNSNSSRTLYGTSSFHKRPNNCVYKNGDLNPTRMAPAVQIRSVIPVCAAPPLVRPQSSTTMKENSSSSSLSVSAQSSYLSSEINKLRL